MSLNRRSGRRGFPAAALVFLMACGDNATGNDGSIQVALSAAGLTVTQGGTTSTSILVSRGGGFTGVVKLAVSGLPTGVLATITPVELSGTTTSAEITLAAGFNAPAGTSSATITATADGLLPVTTALQLTVELAPDYRLTLVPGTIGVTAGSSSAVGVNIQRTNFAGEVALALLDPPAGITGVFTPNPSTTATSSLSLSVAPNVTPATYPIAIQGTATGPGTKTATLTVTVAPNPASYTINLTPAALIVDRGNTAVVNIALARNQFNGTINLAFESPPPGITGSIVPSNTNGNAAVFTINVGDAVATGTYQLTIRGSATGLIDRIAFVQVTVAAPTGANVEYLYCDPSQVPVFFAYQDGSAAWKVVTPTQGGGLTRFTFTLVQGRGGVFTVFQTSAPLVTDALSVGRHRPLLASRKDAAFRRTTLRPRTGARRASAAVAPQLEHYVTEVLFGSATELARDGTDTCGQTQATKTVTGTVAGVSGGQFGIVSLGDATELFVGGVSANPVVFSNVPEGQLDFVGSRLSPGNAPDRVVVFRGLDLPDGNALPSTIDFDGPASSVPATAAATITDAGSDLLEIFTSVVTSNSHQLLWFDLSPSPSTFRPWAGLGPATMIAGDFHGLYAFSTPVSGRPADGRVTLRYVGAVADQSVAMGPNLGASTATQVAPGPYPRYRFQGSIPSAYNKGVSIDVANNSGSGNVFSMIVTSAWLAAAGSVSSFDLTMPDVAGLPGFPVAARLTAGESDAAVSAFGFTGNGIFDLRPSLGAEFKAATRSVTIGVPQ